MIKKLICILICCCASFFAQAQKNQTKLPSDMEQAILTVTKAEKFELTEREKVVFLQLIMNETKKYSNRKTSLFDIMLPVGDISVHQLKEIYKNDKQTWEKHYLKKMVFVNGTVSNIGSSHDKVFIEITQAQENASITAYFIKGLVERIGVIKGGQEISLFCMTDDEQGPILFNCMLPSDASEAMISFLGQKLEQLSQQSDGKIPEPVLTFISLAKASSLILGDEVACKANAAQCAQEADQFIKLLDDKENLPDLRKAMGTAKEELKNAGWKFN